MGTTASGTAAHAEGYLTNATYGAAHAEGSYTTASGESSHAEGYYNRASGESSHAEGSYTIASEESSHAEGRNSIASGESAHAEGSSTRATASSAHAEGSSTQATASSAHAEGMGTVAASAQQHVQGKYNIIDAVNDYAHIVGNGTYSQRSNAHTLDWDGNAWFAGAINCKDKTTTLANLGAAPAVYTYPSVNGLDANTIVNEYHKFVINCANCAYPHGFLDVEKASGDGFSPNGAVPIIQQTMREWSTGHKAYRTSVDNGATWGEWIYETPPMQVGVAYRTAERRSGKPVYTKLIDFGYLPANDTKSVDIGINAGRVFALDGSAYSAISTEFVPIPTGYNGVLGAYAYVWGSGLYVRSTADLSTYSAAFVIKYV